MTPRTGDWRFICPFENCGKFYTRREFAIRHHLKAHNVQPDAASVRRVSLSDLGVQCKRPETGQFPTYDSNDSMVFVNTDYSPTNQMINGECTRFEDSQSSDEGNAVPGSKLPLRFRPPASASTPLPHRNDGRTELSSSDPTDLLVKLFHDQSLQITELRNSLGHFKKENKRLCHLLSAIEELVAGPSHYSDSKKKRAKLVQ